MHSTTKSDEKIMAAMAHGSVLLMFLGPIIPVMIWSSQRKKSTFVSFHALQAMGYQALIFWLWMAGMFLIGLFSVFLIFPLTLFLEKSSNPGIAVLVIQFIIFASIFGLLGIFFLTGVIGAIFCLLGRDFRYPLMGNWLEHFLAYDPVSESGIIESQEENWVAGICHATAILQLWGMVTPLIVWFTQKERSARLRFQSIQAFLYQFVFTIVYLLGMFLYMAGFFGMFFVLVVAKSIGAGSEYGGPMGIMMGGFFVLIMVFWLAVMLLMPVYYLLAGFAAIRVTRGHNFHYPILGRMLEKRMQIQPQAERVP